MLGDFSTLTDFYNALQLTDSIVGTLRVDYSTAVIEGGTRVTITKVDTPGTNIYMIGEFIFTNADWATLQAQYPSLSQGPLP